MPKKWTGDLVGLMHIHRISLQMLAAELGVTDRYASMVLNGHREPSGAKERFEAAVNRLIEKNDS